MTDPRLANICPLPQALVLCCPQKEIFVLFLSPPKTQCNSVSLLECIQGAKKDQSWTVKWIKNKHIEASVVVFRHHAVLASSVGTVLSPTPTPLPIQLHGNATGNAIKDGPIAWAPASRRKLLALYHPRSGHCIHLGSKSMDGRSLNNNNNNRFYSEIVVIEKSRP